MPWNGTAAGIPRSDDNAFSQFFSSLARAKGAGLAAPHGSHPLPNTNSQLPSACKAHIIHSEGKSSPSFSAAASVVGPKSVVFANCFHNSSANLISQTASWETGAAKAATERHCLPRVYLLQGTLPAMCLSIQPQALVEGKLSGSC